MVAPRAKAIPTRPAAAPSMPFNPLPGPSTPPDDPARRAWSAMIALFTHSAHQRRFLQLAAEVDLTPATMKALLSFEDEEPRPMRALAGTWHCDASNVTQLVDGLEEAGFVERRPSVADRRVKLVGITPAGRAARARALDQLHEPPTALRQLSDADLEELAGLLEQVAGHLDDGTGLGP